MRADLFRSGAAKLRSILLAILLVVVLFSFPYGPLFPWSPVKPGYSHLTLKRADVFYKGALEPAYLNIDEYISGLEQTLLLRMDSRVKVIALANWQDFDRFCPWTRGRGVGGVTLETGTVIFITPRIQERHFDTGEFLRHELTHAITNQNMSLRKTQQMKKLHWLMEGVPVWFGRQQAYMSEPEFRAKAAHTDLVPVIDPSGPWPQADMRFAYVAWRDFIEYLVRQKGLDRFRGFYSAILQNPADHDRLFQVWYGAPLPEIIQRFQKSLQ